MAPSTHHKFPVVAYHPEMLAILTPDTRGATYVQSGNRVLKKEQDSMGTLMKYAEPIKSSPLLERLSTTPVP